MVKVHRAKTHEEYNYVLFGIRYDVSDGFNENFIEKIQLILEKRGYRILRKSAGINDDAKIRGKHIHFHCELEALNVVVYKTGESYAFKKVAKELNIKLPQENKSWAVSTPEVATQHDQEAEVGVLKWLRYPLKELKPIRQYCEGIDIDELAAIANAEYKFSLEEIEKKELKKEEDKLRWNKLCAHIDELQPKRYYDVIKGIYLYTQEENPPVSMKWIADKTMSYCHQRNILSVQEMIWHIGDKVLLKDSPAEIAKIGSDTNLKIAKLMEL